MQDFARDEGRAPAECGVLGEREEGLDVIVGGLEFRPVPGEDLGEEAPLMVGA